MVSDKFKTRDRDVQEESTFSTEDDVEDDTTLECNMIFLYHVRDAYIYGDQ